jgi:hypothetical protein
LRCFVYKDPFPAGPANGHAADVAKAAIGGGTKGPLLNLTRGGTELNLSNAQKATFAKSLFRLNLSLVPKAGSV